MQWYSQQVANHPSVVILVVFSLAGTAIIVSFTTRGLPNFRDPLLGFEPRGTVLAQRATAWNNLLSSPSWNGVLSMYPGPQEVPKATTTSPTVVPTAPDSSSGKPPPIQTTAVPSSQPTNQSQPEVILQGDESHTYGRLVQGPPPSSGRTDGRQKRKKKKNQQQSKQKMHAKRPSWQSSGASGPGSAFFCSEPGRNYGHVVVGRRSSTNKRGLLSWDALNSICHLDHDRLRAPGSLRVICERDRLGNCCKSWSIPNYIALLHNRSSCLDITPQDVAEVMERLKICAPYYHSMKLSHDCSADALLCRGVPQECTEYNAIYNILHYLADADFLAPSSSRPPSEQDDDGAPSANNSRDLPTSDSSSVLAYTSIFLPVAQSTAAMDYFKELEEGPRLYDDVTEVVAMELGLKHALFDEYLVHDTVYVGMAGIAVFLVMWMYTQSFLVTLVTCLAVLFSLGTAYFLYTIVFRVPFFPFMNILTLTIAIGIGADDAFIYCKMWGCAKAEKNNGTLVKLVRDTLHHACLSMLVTSVTTATAFFASFTSSITAVRCFSLFAGTAVLANFIFTVTWLPAALILAEKWCSSACCLCIPPFGVYMPQIQRFWCCSPLCSALWRMHYSFSDAARVFFDKILPCIVIRPRWFWLSALALVAAGGAFAIFCHPRLSLPESKEFQILSANHPFERYDLVFKKKFWFEKARSQDPFHKLPIRIVWGVLPIDTGNYLDPFDRGTLVLDPTFEPALPESQEWLLSFCKRLRNQSFYRPTHHAALYSSCIIETFKSWMERRCVDSFKQVDRSPCCESSRFPYSEAIFNLCLRRAITNLHHTPGYYFVPGVAGPRFLRSGQVGAVVIEYDSVYTYSNSHAEMHKFRTEVENWVSKETKGAPPGMRNGWFTSELEFYDLQSSLSRGTLVAMGVAVSVSFVALLMTTLNLLISLYAIITIAFIIFTTVGSLVLLGWKLNVLESITVSVAIGLAVDFTIHYGVAYRLSSQEDRESSVIQSLSRIGSPVAMAAFTTFLAGALMFPSVVLAYLQVGTFLMLVTGVSWTYSTFFFQSLLSLAGPQRGHLQLDYPSFRCCETAPPPVDKTIYALSESTLSTSSASCPAAQIPLSESHELEPLTLSAALNGGAPKRIASKKKPRQRSGSLSAAMSRARDPCRVGNRKVSLPVVSVTFHGDPSPRHVSGATSSSTIVCGCEEDVRDTPPPMRDDPVL
ncbi:protein dispatched homolog 1-like isoform X2 [Ornithodoros turicata]|uniref:protein dispatched homolog 1-like isoform X2 n=1 Tax=Ornithodoros turicata TaxID=34597 RepID=UPI003139469C